MTPEVALPLKAAEEPRPIDRAEILVGIPAAPAGLGAEAAASIAADLARTYASRPAAVLLLSVDGHGAIQAAPASAAASLGPGPTAAQALPALLREARRLDAPVCAFVVPEKHDPDVEWLRLLLDPVLDGGYDLVCPAYVGGKLEGTLHTGIVTPLVRALFGKRLHHPLGTELGISRRFLEALAAEDRSPDPASGGAEVSLLVAAFGAFRVCESFLGRPPERPPDPALELSALLARHVGPIFREMGRHAHLWQRISGSGPVPSFGTGGVRPGAVPAESVSRLVNAFELGYQDLHALWGSLLTPATLLGLKRVTCQPASSFRMDDELWVKLVYDFALGHHMRLMDRAQLLRSMTPLYLGWLASFLNEVRELDGPATEERIERLCRGYEDAKPYLISRWRWPDRFNP